jgi:hypothetical protein
MLRSSERTVVAVFQAATTYTLGNGKSTFFWTDNWLNGSSPKAIAPAVFATVTSRKKKAMVAEALNGNAWVRHINGPLTMQLLFEFIRLCNLLDEIQLSSQPDTFSWRLTADHYSAASTYGAMFFGSSTPLGAK